MIAKAELTSLSCKQQAAVETRRQGASVAEVAKTGVATRQGLWKWRQTIPEFARQWDEATMQGMAELREELIICARLAKDDPRYQTSLIYALKSGTLHELAHSGDVETAGELQGMIEHYVRDVLDQRARRLRLA